MSRHLDKLHADWLRLVEPEGQFLTLPVLQKAFPNGLDNVRATVRAEVRKHYPHSAEPTAEDWNTWIDWLLRDVLGWGAQYRTGSGAAAYVLDVPEHNTTLRASGALIDPETSKPRVLVMTFPYGTALDKRQAGERWNASPIERVKELCKAHDARIGMVTDGGRIVVAWIPDIAGGYATWPTALFTESRERGLLQSFTSLLSASRFFAVREDVQIEALFDASEKAQNEVTNQLGYQIRQAVELLVNSISRANLERDGKLLATVPPQTVYEAAVTVMMRLVFLLYAEERDLLPLSEPLYADFYAASTLREQLDEQATLEGDEPLERRSSAWNRLLATFRVIYGGLNHDRLRLIAYGGRLFDPDRFPFLEGRTNKQKWEDSRCNPLPVDDLTVRAIMEAIQTLPIREGGSSERRRLSFRSLDVEQIGHVYEGLLDHGAVQVDDVYVGLIGKTGDEAEIPLSDIEAVAKRGGTALTAFLAEKTKRGEPAISKLLKDGQMLIQGEDQEMRRLLNTVCDNNTSLSSRIAPLAYALRSDLHGLPVMFPPRSLVVKQTRARRDSGTEYTPRELADEMVRYTLEPLVYFPGPRDGLDPSHWKLKSSEDILALKVCDPAVGSGAFLVSACRYLGDRIVEAWIAEDPLLENASKDDLTVDARRAVVDRCLYGVDRDSIAVEMAKLSLWLTTMHRDRPFSFLDHSIRDGDSLLGLTTLEQIYHVHIDPSAGKAIHSGSLFDVVDIIRPLVEKAKGLRTELEALPSLTYRDAEAKQTLSGDADELLETTRVLADAIVAAALSTSTTTEKRRNAIYHGIAQHIRMALDPDTSENERTEAIELLRSQNQQRLNAGRPENSPPRVNLHWVLEFPEIFGEAPWGFHAIVGNPPFVGGQKITSAFGIDYREYLLRYIGGGKRGSADLVAYFFLRASMLSDNFGFLAADTIAQGDTRAVALEALTSDAWQIVRAVKTRPWPGKAGVHIAQVWLAREATRQAVILDGSVVSGISTLLTPARRVEGRPQILNSNDAIAYIGCYVLGMGFVMDSDVALSYIREDAMNQDVLFPYLTADDLCSRPDASPSRWVVNFGDWSLERAQTYPTIFSLVETNVKPERQRLRPNGTYQLRKPLPQRWWQYGEKRPGLFRAIRRLERVIVMPLHSKVVLPLRYPSNIVFSHRVAVFAREDDFLFGLLSSTIHRSWALRYGSTQGATRIYAPSDCFQTFPLPETDSNEVGEIAAQLELRRSEEQTRLALGLTDFYNLLNSPDSEGAALHEIRSLHTNLDRAVCEAYGWRDLNLDYGFHQTVQGVRWTIGDGPMDEVLDRLLELNHSRHAEEAVIESRATATETSNAKTKAKKAPKLPATTQVALME